MISKDVMTTELLGFRSGHLPLHLTAPLTLNGMAKLTLPRHPSNGSWLPGRNGPVLRKGDLASLHIIKADCLTISHRMV